jgi:hypothetical protein
MAASGADRLADLVRTTVGVELPVRIRAWDGSEAGPADGPVLVVRSRRALRRLLWRPGELGLRRAYVTGDQQLLGVMDGAGFLPDGVPSNWTIFFGAEDVDKTLRVIADIGGAVLREAEDTPYGRLAAATDPTGVIFNL